MDLFLDAGSEILQQIAHNNSLLMHWQGARHRTLSGAEGLVALNELSFLGNHFAE